MFSTKSAGSSRGSTSSRSVRRGSSALTTTSASNSVPSASATPVARPSCQDDVLLAFYDFPAEHWVHLRTTNPIESTFATVRLRTRVTKGPGSSAAGVAMAFKPIEAAQARWRAVNAPHLVAVVRAGATFEKGTLVERPEDQPTPTPAETAA